MSKNVANNFDLCVLGGGPGGYVAAIRGVQLGMKVALVESSHLGGICLNWGCIPTKALLRSAEIFRLCSEAINYGVVANDVKPDIKIMTQRSREASKKLAAGVKGLMKKNKITVFDGFGRFASSNAISIELTDGTKEDLMAKYFIIATGARPRQLAGFESDNQMVWDYKGAMSQEKIPTSLIVVGSGAIGLEFANFYNAIGTKVTVLEAMDRICPLEDHEIGSCARKLFEKHGINFVTGVQLHKMSKNKSAVIVEYKQGNKLEKISGDKLLMAVGTVPNSDDIGLQNVNVNLENGRIKVGKDCITNVDSIFAIGDVNSRGPFLAHKASHEGICVVEKIASLLGLYDANKVHLMNYENVPACTYTTPQIASVGMTETSAIDAGYKVKIGKFNLSANGKAIAMGEEGGMVKVIFDDRTGELLGAHMCGAEVAEMIQGFVIAREGELTENELINSIFPHPTIGETMHEAVLAAFGRVLHS